MDNFLLFPNLRQVECFNKEPEKLIHKEFCLLINGSSLSTILNDEKFENQIKDIFEKADSIIIYRSSAS